MSEPIVPVAELARLLAAPFDPKTVKFKPQAVQGNRALAVPYIDARIVQDRLDQVLGTHNWQDEYTPQPDGSVICTLRVRFDVEWISKTDVGSPSEQPDEHDRVKAAFSDALKRVAVKYGIGRYLYQTPPCWCDYDPQKRQFKTLPSLPGAAATKATARAATKAKRPEPPAEKRAERGQVEEIGVLVQDLGRPADWLAKALDEKFGCTEPAMLYKEEAERVLKGLRDERDKKAKAASVAANGRQPKQQPQEAAQPQELGDDNGRF